MTEDSQRCRTLVESTAGNTDTVYTYGDDLVNQTRSGNTHYYHYDGLGSTRALSDTSGALTDTYNYEAFGTLLNQTGTTDNNYLFTGEQYDSDLGQYYLRARYYNQGIGRFTQMDTFQGNVFDPVSLHKYLYGNVDPVNVIDPSGNFGLVDLNAANSIRNILTDIQINVGFSLFDAAFDSDNAGSNAGTDAIIGLAALGGAAAFKLLGLLSKKFQKACNSFDGDTLVATEQGLKSISKVKIGDQVWSYNEETGEESLQEVIHLINGEGDNNKRGQVLP